MEILSLIISIVLSAVLGYFLSDIISFITFITKRKNFLFFIGDWYVYHFSSYENSVALYEYKANFITKGFLVGTVTLTPLNEGNPTYKGQLYFKRGHNSRKARTLYIECKCTSTQETYTIIIDNIIPNEHGLMYGLETGVDYDDRTHATIRLFSKKKLCINEAKNLINKKAFDDNAATIRI
jgi:hypothetical protein